MSTYIELRPCLRLATRPTYIEPGICHGPKNKTTTWGVCAFGCFKCIVWSAWWVWTLHGVFVPNAPFLWWCTQIVEHASHGIGKEALQWYECEKTRCHLFFFLPFHFLVITYLKWYACGAKLSLIFVCTRNCVKCFRTCSCLVVHFRYGNDDKSKSTIGLMVLLLPTLP